MWKSPIEIIIANQTKELVIKEEQAVLECVTKVVPQVVNKQQLIDALNYDSKQYKNGYVQAIQDVYNFITEYELEDEFGFNFEYWLDKLLLFKGYTNVSCKEEKALEEAPELPDDDDIGYDPFIGSFTDEV